MNHKFLVLCFSMACLIGTAHAQVVNAQMEYDVLNSSEQNYTLTTSTGIGYFAVVSNLRTTSPNGIFTGLSFVMLDDCLDTVWHRHWDSPNLNQPHDTIIAYDVEEIGPGFLVTGTIRSGPPGMNTAIGWAMIVDGLGTVQMFRTYDDIQAFHAGIELTTLDGYILVGEGTYGATALRVNINLTGGGPLPWGMAFYQNFGTSSVFYDVIHLDANNIGITGHMTDLANDINVVAVSMDEFGNHNWSSTYAYTGAGFHEEVGRGLAYNGVNLYITGDYSETSPGGGMPLNLDVLALMLDPNSGTMTWAQHYDMISVIAIGAIESGQKIAVGSDGNLRVTGTSFFPHSTAPSYDGFLLQFDPGGIPLLSTVFTGSGEESLFQLEEDALGTFTMAGTRDNKLFAVQKYPILSANCQDTTFYPTYQTPTYVDASVTRMPVDTTSNGMLFTDTTFALSLDTLCESCISCEANSMATSGNYYHVIDMQSTLAIQGFMNEGDYYSDLGDYKFVFAHTNTQFGMDVSVTKADESGTIIWSKVYSSHEDEEAYCVRRTQDNNFMVLGATHVSNGARQPFLMKISDNGDVLWTKSYENTYNAAGMKMIQHSSGDFVVISITNPWVTPIVPHYPILFTTDNNGNLQNYKLLKDNAGRDWDHFTDLMEDPADNQIVLVGRGGHNRDFNPGLIAKYDLSLNQTWLNAYRFNRPGGAYSLNSDLPTNSHLKIYAVEKIGTDFYAAGVVSDDMETGSNGSFRYLILLKFNAAGVLTAHWPFTANDSPDVFQPFDLRACQNGELVMTGVVKVGADERTFVMRITTGGLIQNLNTYGNGEKNRGTWITEAFNNDFIVIGDHGTSGSMAVRPYYMRISSALFSDECEESINISNENVTLTSVYYNYTLEDEFIENNQLFYSWEVCPVINTCTGTFTPKTMEYEEYELDQSPVEFDQQLTLYPNPVTTEASIRFNLRKASNVEIKVYDIMGSAKSEQPVASELLQEGTHTLSLDVSQLAAGTYICVLHSNEGSHVVRFIVAR